MGCGCRKNKSSSATKVAMSEEQQKALRELSIKRANKALAQAKAAAQIKQSRLKHDLKIVNNRTSTCDLCSLSIFNDPTSDNKFKICSKCNRPIFIICSDASFSCPIGKFGIFQS